MQLVIVSVGAIVAFCLCPPGLALGTDFAQYGQGLATCDSDATSETALLQRSVKKQQQSDWPSIGDLTSAVKTAASDLTDAFGDTVTSAVGDLSSGALVKFGVRLNASLGEVLQEVRRFSKEVEKGDLKSGVATIFAKAFNVTVDKFPTGKAYEKRALKALDKAAKTWGSMTEIVKAVDVTLDGGLETFGLHDLRKHLNEAMQLALSHADAVAAAIEKVKSLAMQAESDERTVKGSKEGTHSKKDQKHSLAQAPVKPIDLMTQLRVAVEEAKTQVGSFSDAFSSLFGKLSLGIVDIANGKMSDDALAMVQDSFQKVANTVLRLSGEVQKAFTTLFSGVNEGMAAVAEEAGLNSHVRGLNSNARGLLGRFNLLAAGLAACFAIGF